MQPQAADMGMTEMAFEPQTGDDRLFVKFFKDAVQNFDETKEKGRPIYDEVDFIEIRVPGDKDNITRRPVRMGQDDMRFPRHWDLYQRRMAGENVGEHVSGTPLNELPFMRKHQVQEFAHFNVTTVEQLVAMPDTHSQQFMGFGALKAKCERFLAFAEDSAAKENLASELQSRDDQIAELKVSNEAMQSKLDLLLEQLAAQQAGNGTQTTTETKPSRRRKSSEN